MHKRSERRAVALILTLMITSLLLMLLGSFFSLNSDQIRLLGRTQLDDQALEAARSGLEYARMRLEMDPSWGLPGRDTARRINSSGMQIWETDNTASSAGRRVFQCVGVLNGGDSHFQICCVAPGTSVAAPLTPGAFDDDDIAARPAVGPGGWRTRPLARADVSINNLAASTAVPSLKPWNDFTPQRALPSRQMLLLVEGVSHGRVRRLEANMAEKTVTQASVFAGRSLTASINQGDWGYWFVGTSPYCKNAVQAKGDMVFAQSSSTDTKLRFLGDRANNRLVTEGNIFSSSGAAPTPTEDADGNLNFDGLAKTAISRLPAQNNANANLQEQSAVSGSDLTASEVEGQLTSTSLNTVNLPGGHYHFTAPDKVTGPDGTVYNRVMTRGSETVAVIRNNRLIFNEGLKVQFNGNTTVSGEDVSPQLLLGYNRSDNPNDWNRYVADNSPGTMIKVNNGSLTVRGGVSGKGSVLALGSDAGQGNIQMEGKSQMSGDADSTVTMYADRAIKVTAPGPGTADFVKSDVPAIAQGLSAYAAPRTGEDSDPWGSGSLPLNYFAQLGSNQDTVTQGGYTMPAGLSDAVPSTASVRTSPALNLTPDAKLTEFKTALAAEFPMLAANPDDQPRQPQVAASLDALVNRLTSDRTTPLTVGGYLRVREFLKETQRAWDRNEANLPSVGGSDPAADSDWANPERQNQTINQQLKSEISFLQQKARARNLGSLQGLVQAVAGATAVPYLTHPLASDMDNENRDIRWTGLMYARGSVFIDAGGGGLDVRGSLVGLKDVALTNAAWVVSIFDPSYLSGLTGTSLNNRPVRKYATIFFRYL